MEKDPSIVETGGCDRVVSRAEGVVIDEAFVDPAVEKRALRKFDYIMIPQIIILVIIAQLDRSNIGNAKVFGLEKGLKLHGSQFNNIVTLFYPTYIVCEVPWVVALKRYGVNRILSISMVGWSVVTLGSGFVNNYSQMLACRILLGVFEGALNPCLIMTISTIWDRNSQAKRVSVIYVASGLSGAFGGLIAYAIQSMGRKHGLDPWRWLFIVEGIISVVLCGLSWLSMPTSAAKAWFLTHEEKESMLARAANNVRFQGTEEKLAWSHIRAAVFEPYIWLGGITLFANSTATLGFGVFLPTIIRGMGYTALQANYLTIPVYLFVALCCFVCAFGADRLKSRAVPLMILPIPTIIGYAMVIGSAKKGVGYAAMFLCGGGMFSLSTLLLVWISINISPDYKRSVGVGIMGMLGNCAGVLSAQIYQTTDAPRYVTGNAISLGMEGVAWVGVALMYLMLRLRGNKKDKMKADGVTTNGKLGDRALDFVYLL
ncbi:putative transporter C11D3.18C [Exophiala dermatitidis]